MKNIDIYNIAKALNETFADTTQYLPVRVNFFIQKNKVTLLKLAQEIEDSRVAIIRNYATIQEDGTVFVSDDKIDIVNKELEDLFNIEQDVDVRKINLNDFPADISLTTGQMESLLFMIE